MLDVYQVLDRLKEIGITGSIQTVRRWLRTGELKGEMPEGEIRKGKKRSAGYRVHPKDLEAFIQKKREENWLYPEVQRLEKEVINLKKKYKDLQLSLRKQRKMVTATTDQQEEEESDDQPSPTSSIQSTNKTISPVELNVTWRQIERANQDPEVEQYLRMNSVKNRLYYVILGSDTRDGNEYVCPLTGKRFGNYKEMVVCSLEQIIDEKRKAHLQWAKENC